MPVAHRNSNSSHITVPCATALFAHRYLVSFMRTADNMNVNEATHKFNQMRRLLTSSGDNWVRNCGGCVLVVAAVIIL